jgi:hypothetical protein
MLARSTKCAPGGALFNVPCYIATSLTRVSSLLLSSHFLPHIDIPVSIYLSIYHCIMQSGDTCTFPLSIAEITWTHIYQAAPKDSSGDNRNPSTKELMLRPPFPSFHKERGQPLPLSVSDDVIALVNDAWRLGDLVDLWCDGCYWSGSIIKLHADDSVEVPPLHFNFPFFFYSILLLYFVLCLSDQIVITSR